jgi:hypothetical protein
MAASARQPNKFGQLLTMHTWRIGFASAIASSRRFSKAKKTASQGRFLIRQ